MSDPIKAVIYPPPLSISLFDFSGNRPDCTGNVHVPWVLESWFSEIGEYRMSQSSASWNSWLYANEIVCYTLKQERTDEFLFAACCMERSCHAETEGQSRAGTKPYRPKTGIETTERIGVSEFSG